MADRKFLIVDDSQTIRLTLQRMLEVSGIPKERIVTVSDGAQAMKQFHKWKPDVVLVDIELPKMKGDAVALKMLEKQPGLKIVVVTGSDRSDARVRNLISQGAFEMLEKPIRLEKLRTLLSLIDSDESGFARLR